MAKKITEKKPLFGSNRSHAMNQSNRTFKPNLQTVTINGKKYRVTARELRTLNKKSAA